MCRAPVGVPTQEAEPPDIATIALTWPDGGSTTPAVLSVGWSERLVSARLRRRAVSMTPDSAACDGARQIPPRQPPRRRLRSRTSRRSARSQARTNDQEKLRAAATPGDEEGRGGTGTRRHRTAPSERHHNRCTDTLASRRHAHGRRIRRSVHPRRRRARPEGRVVAGAAPVGRAVGRASARADVIAAVDTCRRVPPDPRWRDLARSRPQNFRPTGAEQVRAVITAPGRPGCAVDGWTGGGDHARRAAGRGPAPPVAAGVPASPTLRRQEPASGPQKGTSGSSGSSCSKDFRYASAASISFSVKTGMPLSDSRYDVTPGPTTLPPVKVPS